MRKKNSLPEQFVNALSVTIKARREELEISQEDLADQANVHRTYVSLIERKGVNFSMHVFFRIAQALEIQPFDLMLTSLNAVKSKSK